VFVFAQALSGFDQADAGAGAGSGAGGKENKDPAVDMNRCVLEEGQPVTLFEPSASTMASRARWLRYVTRRCLRYT
jgi:hypothetical protein